MRIHLLRMVTENLQLPDELGTGLGAVLMPGILHTYGVSQPWGGSGKLTKALVRCVEYHGGELRLNAEVQRILVADGRAIGVEMMDGERILARDAVIGSIHPHKLRQFVEGVPEPVLDRAERTTLAPFTLFVCHYDLQEPIRFRTSDPAVKDAIMLTLSATDDWAAMQRDYDQLKRGEISRRRFIAGNDESLSDPSRVPPGRGMWHSTGFAPYELAEGGAARWDEFKDEFGAMQEAAFQNFVSNLTPDNIVARKFYSPLDLERSSPNSMVRGDLHGVGPYFYQSAGHRPTPDLGQFRVPGLERLYLVGPFMHPGGGVYGAGRATAMVMFDDLGMDFDSVVSPSASSGGRAPSAAVAAPQSRTGDENPDDDAMRLYDNSGAEIMAIDSITAEAGDLVIRGKTFGTMPLVARLSARQARRGIRLIGVRKLLSVAKWFFGGNDKAAKEREA